MHLKRNVGYVQVALGIMLIFAIVLLPHFVHGKINQAESELNQVVTEVLTQRYGNETASQILLEHSLDQLHHAMTRNIILVSTAIILAVLAAILILQGVANTRTGVEDDVSPYELGGFSTRIFLIAFFITAAYSIFINNRVLSYRVEMAGIFLILLLAFFLLKAFVKKVFKKIEEKNVSRKMKNV